MIKPAKPIDEEKRLQALRELLILDTKPEERFDRITEFASFEFEVPIVLISLVDEDRQWFKSFTGINTCETDRDISFCAHAILQDKIMVVEDATKDERFFDNPLVLDEPHIRFYAGAALTLKNGEKVGTLCLIDNKPKQLSKTELSIFSSLRDMVVVELMINKNTQTHAELINHL